MRRALRIIAFPSVFVAAACGQSEQENQVAADNAELAETAFPTGAAGVLISPGGNELGSVRASDGPEGAVLAIDARGLQPGTHRLRLHASGKCQGPSFDSAGARIDSGSRPLPNVTVDSDGLLRETVIVTGAMLAELRDPDGSALIVHMNPDDPAVESSADKIACAAI